MIDEYMESWTVLWLVARQVRFICFHIVCVYVWSLEKPHVLRNDSTKQKEPENQVQLQLILEHFSCCCYWVLSFLGFWELYPIILKLTLSMVGFFRDGCPSPVYEYGRVQLNCTKSNCYHFSHSCISKSYFLRGTNSLHTIEHSNLLM